MKLLNNLDQNTPQTPPSSGELDGLSQQIQSQATPSSDTTPVSSDTTPLDQIQMGSDGEAAPMDEQSLIQKLLQEKQAGQRKQTKLDALNTGRKRSLSANELADMKYKIFSLVLLALGVVLWVSFVQPLLNEYMSNRKTLATTQEQTQVATDAIAEAQKLNAFAGVVESYADDLTVCINADTDCDDIALRLREYIADADTARKQSQYYLQIGDLSDPKLLVDERSILTNIDLFLLRFGPDNRPQRSNIGDIQSIIISDPTNIQGKMYSVDIEAVINFPSDESLINFLNNAENRIIVNDTIQLPPILYKVEEVSYDIANYTEAQDATIKLTAYYYKDDTTTDDVVSPDETEDTATTD